MEIDKERESTLEQLQDWLEKPMLVLSFVWLALLVVELAQGLNSALWVLGQAIWVLFLGEFALSFTLAPQKLEYLRRNWLKALSLALPALRVFRLARFLRLARFARGVRLVRLVGSVNRGMNALGAALSRRGFGYVLGLTLIITFVGAAGMYALEEDAPGGAGFDSYATALWWTAMLLTTMGSEYWPRTPDGRVLCFFLALYAFSVFGYVTATLATFFIGRDAATGDGALRQEIAALRTEIARLRG